LKEGYTIKDQTRTHFITSTIVDWIDIFSRQIYRDCIIESLSYCVRNKGMILYGYVIMTNHIHLIVQSEDGALSDVIRDFKKYTATRILDLLQNSPESRREWILERLHKATFSHIRNKNYQVWQAGNHAEEIYSEKFLWSKLDYIHLNPVRSGFVARASDYVYSSASNYIYGNGVLEEVTLADNPVADVLKSWSISRYNSY
jgi:REP element-mobilizing transposase RayT